MQSKSFLMRAVQKSLFAISPIHARIQTDA